MKQQIMRIRAGEYVELHWSVSHCKVHGTTYGRVSFVGKATDEYRVENGLLYRKFIYVEGNGGCTCDPNKWVTDGTVTADSVALFKTTVKQRGKHGP